MAGGGDINMTKNQMLAYQVFVFPRPNSTIGQMKNPVAWPQIATISTMILMKRRDSLLFRENKAEKNLTTEMVDSYNKNLNIGIKLFNSCFNIKTITDATHKQMEINLDIQQNTLDGISNFINSLTKQSKATLNNMELLAGHQYQNNLTNLN